MFSRFRATHEALANAPGLFYARCKYPHLQAPQPALPDHTGPFIRWSTPMAEPSTATVVVAGAAGYTVGALLGPINGEAAIGAIFGALIYFTTTRELPIWQRVLFCVASAVMGYLFVPAITEVELWGVRPFKFPAPAAFVSSALVVTMTLFAIKRRGAEPPDQRPSVQPPDLRQGDPDA